MSDYFDYRVDESSGLVSFSPAADFAVDGIRYSPHVLPRLTVRPMLQIVSDYCNDACDVDESECLWLANAW